METEVEMDRNGGRGADYTNNGETRARLINFPITAKQFINANVIFHKFVCKVLIGRSNNRHFLAVSF